MAAVKVSPVELADRLGLVTAGELIPGHVPITRGAGPVSVLPVTEDLRALLPEAGLAGQVAIPSARPGATSLLWRLLAGPSSAGQWCAVVGARWLYPLAATAAGVALERVALVDVVGPEEVLTALGALCEGVPVVAASSTGLSPQQVQRAVARARRSGTILIWREGSRPVPGVDVRLDPEACQWRGLRRNAGRRWGAGRLDSCWLSVAATWRGNERPRRAEVWPYGEANGGFGEVP
ncbi:hypothetical protein AB0K52_22475 [Glycomyces sp. NPDC049804]|uniref:hypothetical protein n=1 Tax=Glycomyces sp. NPDC049804 TaxID=3154363 RepID=UPI0034463174